MCGLLAAVVQARAAVVQVQERAKQVLVRVQVVQTKVVLAPMGQERAKLGLVQVRGRLQARVVQVLVVLVPELVNKFPAAATALHNPHVPAAHAHAVVHDRSG